MINFTFNKKILLLSLYQMIVLLMFFIVSEAYTSLYLAVIGTILNFLVTFGIVNFNKVNLFNASSYFLLGVALLLLGKYISFFLDRHIYTQQEISCFDFFVYYCMDYYDHINILSFINLTIIAFSLGHGMNIKNSKSFKVMNNSYQLKYIQVVNFLMYFVLVYVVYASTKNMILTIQKGYMFLYGEGVSENYQTPMLLIFQSILLAYIAFLYTYKIENNEYIKHYRIFLISYLIILYSGILTGGRGGFISAILISIWLTLSQVKISPVKYVFFLISAVLLLSFTDIIGGLTGARVMVDGDRGVFEGVKHTFFSQGASVFVLDSALKMEEVSFLGYLKTIIPGIQILYTNLLGITERYMFDWSSYLAYSNNPVLYYEGYGLGWSVFADFYLLSFKFFPLYLLLVLLFGFFINRLYFSQRRVHLGILFILMFNIFILPRVSISPIIFTLFIYFIFYIVFKKRRYIQKI